VLLLGQWAKIRTDGYFSRTVDQNPSPVNIRIKWFDPAVAEIHKDRAQSLCPTDRKVFQGGPDFDIYQAEFPFREDREYTQGRPKWISHGTSNRKRANTKYLTKGP
jgi:hypothetical protein